jgi:class 3 adenylate cyclase
MGVEDDLREEVDEIFDTGWEIRDGEGIPEPEDVSLDNEAVSLEATVLYADLAESTALVDSEDATFAAEIYKAYLHCAAKVIRGESGEITAFDGDRIMAIFLGGSKNTQAVRAALKIKYAVLEIINPSLEEHYGDDSYVVRQAVGVDTSTILAARTGIRGSNDLVWVGRAANYAAKLCGLRYRTYSTWITGDVYDSMHKSVIRSRRGKGVSMWEEMTWDEMDDLRVFRSSWYMRV